MKAAALQLLLLAQLQYGPRLPLHKENQIPQLMHMAFQTAPNVSTTTSESACCKKQSTPTPTLSHVKMMFHQNCSAGHLLSKVVPCHQLVKDRKFCIPFLLLSCVIDDDHNSPPYTVSCAVATRVTHHDRLRAIQAQLDVDSIQ